jgi:NDP-sugar pyrophosphorylase family protein
VRVAEGALLPDDCAVQGPAWICRDCHIGSAVRLTGPVVIGAESRIGDRSALRDSIVFSGTTLRAEQIALRAIYGPDADRPEPAPVLADQPPRELARQRARRTDVGDTRHALARVERRDVDQPGWQVVAGRLRRQQRQADRLPAQQGPLD